MRNVIRVPEAIFFYIPSGISCAVSPRRQRLGDHAARTVVVRRRMTVTAPGAPGAAPGGRPTARRRRARRCTARPSRRRPSHRRRTHKRPRGRPRSRPSRPAHRRSPRRSQHLKTAALASRGAHLNYLRFSERELAAGADDPARSYSEEYVSAWFTLTDAVVALRTARDDASASAGASGQTLDEVCAAQPDLAHLLRELTPYFTADGDEEIHEAFLAVARSEESSS